MNRITCLGTSYLVAVAILACGRGAEGKGAPGNSRAPDSGTTSGDSTHRLAVDSVPPGVVLPAAPDTAGKKEQPFTTMSGYVVRGTDESSFLRCGSPVVHYTRVSPMAIGALVQRYRFRARRPLTPVYFTFQARVIDDSLTIGSHHYTSIVEIERVHPDLTEETPKCAPPRAGSLIER